MNCIIAHLTLLIFVGTQWLLWVADRQKIEGIDKWIITRQIHRYFCNQNYMLYSNNVDQHAILTL